jgi:hypothetical protein
MALTVHGSIYQGSKSLFLMIQQTRRDVEKKIKRQKKSRSLNGTAFLMISKNT